MALASHIRRRWGSARPGAWQAVMTHKSEPPSGSCAVSGARAVPTMGRRRPRHMVILCERRLLSVTGNGTAAFREASAVAFDRSWARDLSMLLP
jgi:hypothetical protein